MNEERIQQCKNDISKLQEELKKLENDPIKLAHTNDGVVFLATPEVVKWVDLHQGDYIILRLSKYTKDGIDHSFEWQSHKNYIQRISTKTF